MTVALGQALEKALQYTHCTVLHCTAILPSHGGGQCETWWGHCVAMQRQNMCEGGRDPGETLCYCWHCVVLCCVLVLCCKSCHAPDPGRRCAAAGTVMCCGVVVLVLCLRCAVAVLALC